MAVETSVPPPVIACQTTDPLLGYSRRGCRREGQRNSNLTSRKRPRSDADIQGCDRHAKRVRTDENHPLTKVHIRIQRPEEPIQLGSLQDLNVPEEDEGGYFLGIDEGGKDVLPQSIVPVKPPGRSSVNARLPPRTADESSHGSTCTTRYEERAPPTIDSVHDYAVEDSEDVVEDIELEEQSSGSEEDNSEELNNARVVFLSWVKNVDKGSKLRNSLWASTVRRCFRHTIRGRPVPSTPPSGYERERVVQLPGTPAFSEPQPLLPPASVYKYRVDQSKPDLRDIFKVLENMAKDSPGEAPITFARVQRTETLRFLDDIFSKTTSITHTITVPETGHTVKVVTDPNAMRQWVIRREETKRRDDNLDEVGILILSALGEEDDEDMEDVPIPPKLEVDFEAEDVERNSAHGRVPLTLEDPGARHVGIPEEGLSSDADWDTDDDEPDVVVESWRSDLHANGYDSWEDDPSRF